MAEKHPHPPKASRRELAEEEEGGDSRGFLAGRARSTLVFPHERAVKRIDLQFWAFTGSS
jgi:hypothetical protein